MVFEIPENTPELTVEEVEQTHEILVDQVGVSTDDLLVKATEDPDGRFRIQMGVWNGAGQE